MTRRSGTNWLDHGIGWSGRFLLRINQCWDSAYHVRSTHIQKHTNLTDSLTGLFRVQDIIILRGNLELSGFGTVYCDPHKSMYNCTTKKDTVNR